MQLNEILTTIKDNIWVIIVGILAIALGSAGFKKISSNKQISKNEDLIKKTEQAIDAVEKEKAEVEEIISKATEDLHIVEEKIEESKTTQEKIENQIDKNASILEKYKK